MVVDLSFLWLAFLGLFAIINPFSTVFVFLGLTSGTPIKQKNFYIKKATISCFCILTFFMISGNIIFKIFNITIEAFQVAGALIVMHIGFAMINPKLKDSFEDHKKELSKKEDISLIPLAIPMLSGPGAIATTLVWTSKATTFANKLGLIIVVLLISIIAYLFLKNADLFKKVLGKTGTSVIERLMGLIVLVMGVQFLINALKVIVPSIL